MASREFVKDPRRAKKEFDLGRIRFGALASGVMLSAAAGASFPPLLLPIWNDADPVTLLNLVTPEGQVPPRVSATIWDFDFRWPAFTPAEERRSGFSWDQLCDPEPAAAEQEVECDNATIELSGVDCTNWTARGQEQAADAAVTTTTLDPEIFPPFSGHVHTCTVITSARVLIIATFGVHVLAAAFVAIARLLSSVLLLVTGAELGILGSLLGVLALVSAALAEFNGLLSGPGAYCTVAGVLVSFFGASMGIYQAAKGTPERLLSEEEEEKAEAELEGPSFSKEELQDWMKQALVDGKEGRSHDDDDPNAKYFPRLERHRVVQEAFADSTLQELGLEDWQTSQRFHNSSKARSRGAQAAETFTMSVNEIQLLQKKHTSLQAAIAYVSDQAGKGKAAQKIPEELLEQAFQDIDIRQANAISVREFRCAMKTCGIDASQGALDMVLEEVDGNSDGMINTEEFGQIFSCVEDLLMDEARVRSDQMLTTALCQLCFLTNFIGVGYLVLMITQSQEPPSEFLMQCFIILCIILALLAISVIFLPLMRTMVGSKSKIWRQLWRKQKRRWKKNCVAKIRHLVGRCAACCGSRCRKYCCCCRCCSCCRDSEDGAGEETEASQDEDPEQGSSKSSSKGPVIAWAETEAEGQTQLKSLPKRPARPKLILSFEDEKSEAASPSSSKSPASPSSTVSPTLSFRSSGSRNSPKSRTSSKGSSRKSPKGGRRQNQLGRLSGVARRLSKLNSREGSMNGRQKQGRKTVRKKVTNASDGEEAPGGSFRRMGSAPSLKRQTTRGLLPPNAPLWQRMLPAYFQQKLRQRQRRSRQQQLQQLQQQAVNEPYSPAAYEAAALRALAASHRPASSFTPMQVRDLRRLPLPEEEPQVFML